ncbi:uncharacterized protein B0H64DRAFT_195014 [Chaetomium fimeti]|uniref:Uncharacterized protein n=1 Tax=Chaetomium fimeti TaxID=1854472 RepID=A0AAE0HDX8_9PEZI|nr:hypothetical protein B0H64DRAFT_195014 [Chaetomium fimeti]
MLSWHPRPAQKRRKCSDCTHTHTHTCQPAPSRQLSNKEPQCLGQEMARQGYRERRGVKGGGIDWLTPATRRGVSEGGSQASDSNRPAVPEVGVAESRIPGSQHGRSKGRPVRPAARSVCRYTCPTSSQPGRLAHWVTGTTGYPREVVGGVGRTCSPCKHHACLLPITISGGQNARSDPFSDRLKRHGAMQGGQVTFVEGILVRREWRWEREAETSGESSWRHAAGLLSAAGVVSSVLVCHIVRSRNRCRHENCMNSGSY